MKCRFCKTELVKGERRVFETLCDHVSDPNNSSLPLRDTYICPDSDCLANEAEGFWDEQGVFYYSKLGMKELGSYGRLSAIDSFDMKMEIEIYKKDENFTIWKGLKWWLVIEFKYKAGMSGNILKRTPTLSIRRRDFNSILDMLFFWNWKRNGWINHNTNLRMFKFCKGQYIKAYDRMVEDYKSGNIAGFAFWTDHLLEIVSDSGKYKKWGRQSKPWHIIHATYEWYRPLSDWWIIKRYLKDCNNIRIMLEGELV